MVDVHALACCRDGQLHSLVDLDLETGQAVVRGIKILSRMNLVEYRHPQDGGLTVHHRLVERFATADFIYLADQVNAPYGGRPGEEIVHLTRAGCERLFAAGCDLVVLACNTAAAVALRRLQQTWLPGYRRALGRPVNVLGIIVRGEGDGRPLRRFTERVEAVIASDLDAQVADRGATPRLDATLISKLRAAQVVAAVAWFLDADDADPAATAAAVNAANERGWDWAAGLA